jgi:hypothetical protein
MIDTIYPYGSVNIKCIRAILEKGEKKYFIDDCGKWLISEETFNYLESRGIRKV